MKLRWLAVPAVLLLAGCADPAARYRKAARQLTFTLDRVDPSLHLALPLERSKLLLHLTLGVENPTATRFHARSISGRIFLDTDGVTFEIGELAFLQGLDLKPASHTPMAVDLSFNFNDLQKAWGSLRNVSGGARPGTWRLEGQVRLEVAGIPLTLPLRVQKHVSGQ
jgi:LEA14-like dessication related protein